MFVGKYYRKSGDYNPNDGWCRKWTYKIGYEVSGKKMRLVAMTDGMISQVKGHEQINEWIEGEGMTLMTKDEIMAFFCFECANLKDK